MYSSEDFERLYKQNAMKLVSITGVQPILSKGFYFQYKAEALPQGISIESFCLKNKVPYNIFSKWYRDTCKGIMEVKVDGRPDTSSPQVL